MAAGTPVTAMLLCGRGGLTALDTFVAGRAAALAGRLRGELRFVLVGGREEDAQRLPGTATITLVDGLDEGCDTGAHARLLATFIDRGVALLPATREGNEIAARAAARVGGGLAANARSVEAAAGSPLTIERTVYADRATATVALREGIPAVVTLNGEGLGGRWTAATGSAQTRFAALDQTVAGFRVVGRRLPGPWEMDIGEAEVVVAGGKGVATKEAFGLLAELAGLLGGAVGASRPVVDVGLVPPSRQVGLSGRTITPRLYIACGISGSPHHLVGMRGSGSVISINSDPHAPIHALSDVRLVGDAAVLLPRLIEQVRSRTETRRAALRELSEVRV